MSVLPIIAMLGTGAMGSRVAEHLLAAGYTVHVYNRTAEHAAALTAKGALLATSPRDAARVCDVAIAYLRDDDASRCVWLDEEDGALAGMRPGTIAIESSTLSPAFIHELAHKMEAAGARFLDAPVAGSRPQAQAQTLVSLVGGDAAVLESVRPILSVTSNKIFHVGPVGSGAILKLGVNAFMATQVAGVAELFTGMSRQGLDKKTVYTIISELPTTSPYIKAAGALMVAGNDAPLFPIELIEKDLRYAEGLASEKGLELTVMRAVHTLFSRALDKKLGTRNITSVEKIVD